MRFCFDDLEKVRLCESSYFIAVSMIGRMIYKTMLVPSLLHERMRLASSQR